MIACHQNFRKRYFTQKQSRAVYLKLWIEGEEEGLSSAIKAIADFKRLRCQRTKHLEKQNTRATDYGLLGTSLTSMGELGETYVTVKPLQYVSVEFAAYLAVAVLNNHEHWGVLALHGSVQRLNAHAML